MENMCGGPEDDLAHRPKRGWAYRFHFGDGNQAAEDLRVNAEQSEVHEAESKSDAKAKAPVQTLCFLL